ncbi:MAG: response regulator [Burkholderiales bacterium]|nr:response regulator [Burkholderiales bacterium]
MYERAGDESQWYAVAMEKLVEVVQDLSMARDLANVMDIVRRAARNLTGADGATFVLRDGDQCFYAEEDAIAPLWKGSRFPMSACISGWAMLNRRPAVIEDIYADSRIPADAYRPTFVKSLAMVPIRTRSPVGAIGTYWAKTRKPKEAEVRVIQALADSTSLAMENVRVYGELEQRVRQRTSELSAILDNVQVGVAFSVDGKVALANPKSAELFGYGSDLDLHDLPLSELFRSPDGGDFDSGRKALVQEGILETEKRLLRHDDSPFWGRLLAKRLDPSIYPDGEIWVIEDTSDSKAREAALTELRMAAEEATRFKSEFLASMSHELRTPLNAIIGFSEVLKDGMVGELAEKQKEYIEDIFESGLHLLSLINDVLDLSKIEAGKMVLEDEPTEVSLLLGNCLSIVKERAMAHRITLKSDLSDELGVAWIDPRKCKQIVYNLLSNAVKFTPEGGTVTLSAGIISRSAAKIRAESMAKVCRGFDEIGSESLLQISVKDTGIGISAEDMARLFQPFVQIDSSLSKHFEGTGLGLALVKKLAILHGGSAGLESRVGEGSTFTVWIPHVRRANGEDSSPDAETMMGGTVLLVEDDDRAADLMRLQLEMNGCTVMRASSAEAAFSQLGDSLPDLVVLDLLLPGMDGWEFLSRLKSEPGLSKIPVVISSIVAENARGIALGASVVLQKPVTMSDISGALSHLGLPGHSGLTVLVVDDDPKALELASSCLENEGFSVMRAHGGSEAIRLAREHLPDLVVLDLVMPEMNGFEVAEKLKEDERTAKLPIMVLTAKDLSEEERRALEGQVRKIMEKSKFDRAGFLREVKRAMGRWEAGSWQAS